MNMKLILFSAACLAFAIPAAGTSLLVTDAGVKGTIIRTGHAEATFSSSSGSDSVVIQTHPGSIAVEEVPRPVQQVVVQPPVVHYKPAQTISVVPVAVTSSNSLSGKLSSLLGGISNIISTKTRAVSSFLNSLHGPPQIVVINPPTTTTTTTTKKPLHFEVIASVPEHRYYRVLDEFDKKK